MKRFLIAALMLLVVGFGRIPSQTHAAPTATITVTSSADSGPGSLRQALLDATDGDIIDFDPSLAGQNLKHFSDLPAIDFMLTINGGGQGIEISGGTAVRSGIEIGSNGAVAVVGIAFVDGLAQDGGAFHNEGRLVLNNVTLFNNEATGEGGAVYSTNLVSIAFTTFENNEAVSGGGLYARGQGGMASSAMVGNSAEIGAAASLATGQFELSDVAFTDNAATNTGGALAIGATVNCTICTFTDNTATNSGGAITVDVNGDVTLNTSGISGSSASQGGSIFNVGSLTLNKTDVDDSSATSAGGGIYNAAALVINANSGIVNSSHSDCTSGNPSSSDRILLAANGTYTFNTTAPSITSHIEIDGANAVLTHIDARFFFIPSSGSLSLFAITLEGSNGQNSAIGAEGSLHIENSTLRDNISLSKGGAILIEAPDSSTYTFVDVAFIDNVADVHGGAMYISTVSPSSNSTVNVLIDSVEFSNNGRSLSAGIVETDDGGALYITENAQLGRDVLVTIVDSIFTGNFAEDVGGALQVQQDVDLVIERTTFDSNTAGSGGALANSFANVTIRQSTFSNNAATSTRFFAGGGGAIRNLLGTTSIYNSTLSGNQALRGGALVARTAGATQGKSTVTVLDHVTITENTATDDSFGYGGGIYMYASSDDVVRIHLQNSIVLGNHNSIIGNFDCRIEDGLIISFGYNVKSGSALAGCNYTSNTGDVSVAGVASSHIFPTLQDNGGPTLTHRLTTSSDARDLIPNGVNGCGAASVDQRNVLRQSGNAGTMCDAGAYEWGATAAPTAVMVGSSSAETPPITSILTLIVLLLGTGMFTSWRNRESP